VYEPLVAAKNGTLNGVVVLDVITILSVDNKHEYIVRVKYVTTKFYLPALVIQADIFVV
jgi:hypothetical protein